MENRSLISITDYTKEDYLEILSLAEEFEAHPHPNILNGKVVATLFFEPSTRTRLSFESAVKQLGGNIIGFAGQNSSSITKGESLRDTIKTVANYCDLIIMRHPLEGSARYASEVTSIPIINAGDGTNQHPTQTLLDLYSIKKTQGRLDNLNIFLIGDLKYGRTVHSLIMAMSQFNTKFTFISPEELKMPNEYKMYLDKLGISYVENNDFTELISEADIFYMTRVQKERFSDILEYERTKNAFELKNSMLEQTKDNLRILHPLPRVGEINEDVDNNTKAYYFTQARNGVYTRQALIAKTLELI